MIELFHEIYVQILTVVFMAGVIVLAVFLGHKLREFIDRKKKMKADQALTNNEQVKDGE